MLFVPRELRCDFVQIKFVVGRFVIIKFLLKFVNEIGKVFGHLLLDIDMLLLCRLLSIGFDFLLSLETALNFS
jgi:hypothetical protein